MVISPLRVRVCELIVSGAKTGRRTSLLLLLMLMMKMMMHNKRTQLEYKKLDRTAGDHSGMHMGLRRARPRQLGSRPEWTACMGRKPLDTD